MCTAFNDISRSNSLKSILHKKSAVRDPSLPGSVRFDKVKIREYGITLGDNPSCSNGPPISLTWDYNQSEEKEVPLETYEERRCTQRRRMYRSQSVPGTLRLKKLRSIGVPMKDIMSTQIELEEIQKQSRKTMKKFMRKENSKKNIKNFARQLLGICSFGTLPRKRYLYSGI